ncbi:hypothetical protein ApDm4_0858 [Acetobacter pomorum]|nr:hypothetical protein ApDm4_0858 [Acetobacter pomorum]
MRGWLERRGWNVKASAADWAWQTASFLQQNIKNPGCMCAECHVRLDACL